jgi:nucleoside-diphosphate-sugar epimerase
VISPLEAHLVKNIDGKSSYLQSSIMDEPMSHKVRDEDELNEVLTRPSERLVQFIRSVQSPLLILGAGGKMGPSLAVLAKRAALQAGHPLEVIAASRFTDGSSRTWLEAQGVRTQPCDLLDRAALRNLPETANLIYLVGLKFGTSSNPAATWAMNTLVPANVSERFPGTRIVALSTGNVYPLTEISRGGAQEEDSLTPLGEYPNAAVARERIFEFFSRQQNTPVAIIRLFYAFELRYGVPVDIAQKILQEEPIDLTNGYFNCIWQGDANEMIIRSLGLATWPPSAWNLCRREIFSVRNVAAELGEIMGGAPLFKGTENSNALLGNAERICQKLGDPVTPFEVTLRWVAEWVKAGGRNLARPTHFEVRDGAY